MPLKPYFFCLIYSIKTQALKIYSYKTKSFKSVFYCYVHQLTHQNTTFMHYLEDGRKFSVVFITPYLMLYTVILWNSSSILSENK